jgi:hypothetical protein
LRGGRLPRSGHGQATGLILEMTPLKEESLENRKEKKTKGSEKETKRKEKTEKRKRRKEKELWIAFYLSICE